ncbi:MAG: IGHMBP2 family helicase [Planctomycetes bacterium]|nr:IGHMBP2 family helicase [Planctomycetota bacterium]
MDRRAFVTEQLRLLGREREAEVAAAERLLQQRSDAELTARGVSLLRLEVADLEPGFGGRLHVILRPSRSSSLPSHRLGPGDVVALRAQRDAPPLATGVVVQTRSERLTVALDDDEVELPSILRVDQLATDVTFRRLEAALREVGRDRRRGESRLVEALFGEREPQLDPPPEGKAIAWFDPTLDDSQREAVAMALRADPIGLIHGPPGTGKTTAVVELIRQVVARGQRVLACAPSNVAVDNLAERLWRAGLRVVRMGHPARIQAALREVALAEQVLQAPEQKLLRNLRREIDQGLRLLQRARSRPDRAIARDRLRDLRRDLRQIESATTRGLVDGAEVVLATTAGAADPLLAERTFDLAVVDEAAQALEAACWIPLLRAQRAVLAGDHRQLPPTLHSAAAGEGGLAETLFERLAAQPAAAACIRMLGVQYRMHERIMAWPSRRFYADRLRAAPAVAGHLLTDLPEVATTEWTSEPLVFLDTAGCGHEETTGDDEGSKSNPGEAELVVRVVTDLMTAGVPADAIGVVTPYNAQVQLLRERLGGIEGLELGTVDGLQGREKEAVVVSLVRSNDSGTIGFLAELRRLNVALTRARRHLTIIGDSATLAFDDDLRELVEHLHRHARCRSAFELG